MLGVRFTPSANACFRPLTPEQRREIIRSVAKIQLDPVPDNRIKIVLSHLGTMYTLHDDPRGYWVAYHVRDGSVLVVGLGVGGPYVPVP